MSAPIALLASVKHAAEARLAVAAGAGVIDAKDPAAGALGALPEATVRAIVAAVARRVPVSATAGDHPDPAAATARAAIETLAGCGVDFVKLGLFPTPALKDRIAALAPCARAQALVGVFFADRWADYASSGGVPDLVARLADAGFTGAMLDTADKRAGSLRVRCTPVQLAAFVAAARAAGLRCGLAGALRMQDLAPLRQLAPDLLGFRTALCARGARAGELDRRRVRALVQALAESSPARAAL
jgi:uncharacterized protein (UPF0264 family)